MNRSGQSIAVVGSGISGLTACHLLSRQHHVTLYEAADYLGGHTHTVPVDLDLDTGRQHYEVDTGFIVCNDRNYPNFLHLMDRIGVKLRPTEMSFSVANPTLNLEYNGHNLDTLFAQRRNLVNPAFLRFVLDILRFNKAAKAQIESDSSGTMTLNEFLQQLQLGRLLRDNYLLPMVAAIWSCSVKQAGEFPLEFFLRFFLNHGLLDIKNRPQWYVLDKGSSSYVTPLTAPYRESILLNTAVTAVRRNQHNVEVFTNEHSATYDQVVLACHSDQALGLLDNPTRSEQSVLSAIGYQDNEVILHWDASLMPARKKAWASWNFRAAEASSECLPVVTYCMNILQGIGSIADPKPLLVSLNARHQIDTDKVIGEYRYAHPIYSLDSSSAQQRRDEICGVDRIHYCGAYWYNGFHEDGVRSALDVCDRFGINL